jgi:rare lipoprotein A (peptidoglycan hydrolase)
MHRVSVVGDAGLATGWDIGRVARTSGRIVTLLAAFVLGACAREDAPTANWRTTTEPSTSLVPMTAPPTTAAEPSGSYAPMAPSMQTLTPPAPSGPPMRDPCLTKWGSPRLDAPDGCTGRGPRASRAQPPSASPGWPAPTASRSLPSRGIYKIGKPYTVAGKTYVPAENPNYDETGIASWYGDGFHGGPTANGEVYDMHLLTAAHKTLPMPSYAYVHNPVNGRTIMVRINNRGPFKGNRIIDLSHEAARQLDFQARGLATVRVTYAGPAPLDGNDTSERAFLAQQPWYRSEVAAGTSR